MAEAQQQQRVVIFTTPACSWCRRAKQYMAEKQVRFKEIDVSRDEDAARDMMRRTGQMGVPVILVGNRPIVGFNRSELDRLLNLH